MYGAAFTPRWEAHHCRVDNVAELEKLQGSKYVQSCIGAIYTDVKKKLTAGSPVLFSGTPCQCEGLRGYLGKEYDGLYLIDLICHGVPSPLVWRKYLQYVRELKKGAQISGISFRSKNLSWERFLLEFTFVNSSKYRNDLYTDIYLRGFLRDLYLRRSCYQCSCRKMHRFSDLTIADFWGIQDVMPSMYDGRGTSLVLVQNEKGRRLLSGIDADMERVDFAQAIRGNPSYLQSPAMNPKREGFFLELGQGRELGALLNDCLKESLGKRIKSRLRAIKILRDAYHCIRK